MSSRPVPERLFAEAPKELADGIPGPRSPGALLRNGRGQQIGVESVAQAPHELLVEKIDAATDQASPDDP